MMCHEDCWRVRSWRNHSKSFSLAGACFRVVSAGRTALYPGAGAGDELSIFPSEQGARGPRWRSCGGAGRDLRPIGPARCRAGGFQMVVRGQRIPRQYAEDLIDGMAIDVGMVRYRTFDELLRTAIRVAGTVGLMMAHIMKVGNRLPCSGR